MPISVCDIMDSLSHLWRIRLIAGKGGIKKTDIHWVSIVEDYNTEKFKNINEIVITSCLNNTNESCILSFVVNLHKAKARALIINVGKYIKEVPNSVIDYCNKIDLPLYTIPWDVLMSDVSKEISFILMKNETENINTAEIMKTILLDTKNINEQMNKLTEYGFSNKSSYCPAILKVKNLIIDKDYENFVKRVKVCCDRVTGEISAKYVAFSYNGVIVFVFIDMGKKEIDKIIKTLMEELLIKYLNHKVYICVGHLNDNIYNLSVNFNNVSILLNAAVSNNSYITYYDDMELYKIIIESINFDTAKKIFDRAIATLKRYDSENNMDLSKCIKTYINYDGNVKKVANELFVHRNTINNKMRKINEITGINPITLDGKVLFSLAIKISELYGL